MRDRTFCRGVLIGLLVVAWGGVSILLPNSLNATNVVSAYKTTVFDKNHPGELDFYDTQVLHSGTHPLPPLEYMTTLAQGNTAKTEILCPVNTIGTVIAQFGFTFNWDLGSAATFDEIKDRKVDVKINFNYAISAQAYSQWQGASANVDVFKPTEEPGDQKLFRFSETVSVNQTPGISEAGEQNKIIFEETKISDWSSSTARKINAYAASTAINVQNMESDEQTYPWPRGAAEISINSIKFIPKTLHGLFVGFHQVDLNGGTVNGDVGATNVRNAFSQLENVAEAKLVTADISYDNGSDYYYSIKSAIDGFNMHPDDTFFLYISSHGAHSGVGLETTKTAGNELVQVGFDKFLSDDGLAGLLTGLDERITKYIVIDACYAGGFWGNNNGFDLGDLEKLPNVALLASAEEDRTAGMVGGLGIFDMGLPGAFEMTKGGYCQADDNLDGQLTLDEIRNWMITYMLNNGDFFRNSTFYEKGFGDVLDFDFETWNPVALKSDDFVDGFSATPTPLPASVLLLGSGLFGLGLLGWRRRKQS